MFHFRLTHLNEVAIGSTKCIGGIKLHVHVLFFDMEHTLKHACHLFFRSRTISCDCHFDFAGFVFCDGNIAHDGGGDGYTLGTSKFEHRLYVFAEEGGFNSHFVGLVRIDDGGDALKYFAQTEIMTGIFLEFNDTHCHEFCLIALHAQHTIAHDVGARVNAKDDFLYVWISFH